MADGRIEIDVILDDGSIAKGVANIDGLGKSSEKAGTSISSMVKAMGLMKIAGAAIDAVKSSLDSAISRFDIMQKFPKVMDALGFSAEDSQKSITKLSDGIDGLPTKLDDVVASTQQMTAITGDLDKSTDLVIGLNNAFLASGASSDGAARGMQQYNKILSTGKVELDSWQTLQETMPLALQKTAEAFGLTGKSAQNDLYAKLQAGEITIDQLNDKFIELGTGTGMMADLAKKNSLGIATSIGNLKNSIAKNVGNIITKLDEITEKLTGKTIAQNIDGVKVIINSTFAAIIKSMDKIIPIIEKVTGFIKNNATAFKILIAVLGSALVSFLAFNAVIGVMNSVKNAIASVKIAFAALKVALITNPFVAILAGIVALSAAFIYFYKTSEPFREKVNGIIEAIKKFSAPLENVIKGIGLLTKGFIEMMTNGPGNEIARLREQFLNLLPESLWRGMIKFASTLNDLKAGIQGIGKIISGSITNLSELGDFLGGSFTEQGEKNILAIGNAIKNLIGWFKNLINPSEQAGKSVDILGIGFKILKSVFLALLGPVGLAIKAFELIAKALGGGDINKGIDTIMQSFDGLTKGIQTNAPKLGKSFGQALEGILGAIAKALPGIISGALQVVSGFVSGIAKGLPMLTIAAFQLITAFTEAMLVLIPTVVLSATAIIVAFLGALTIALPKIIVAGANLVKAILQGITEQLPSLITSAANLIVTWLTALNEHMPEILQAGFNLLITFLQGIASNIGAVTNQAISIVVNFAQAVVARMPDIVNAAVNLIVSFVNGLASRMPDIIGSAATLIANFINGIANNLGQIIAAAVNLIVKFIEGIAQSIPDIVNAAMGLIDAMVQGLLQAQDRLFKAVTTLINGMAENIRNNKDSVRDAALNLLDAIIGVFVPDALMDAGKAIIKGFLKGLTSAFEEVKDFVGGIATWIQKNKGPISYDRKLLIKNGMSIMEGLDKGLQNSFKNVQDTVSTMANKLNNNMNLDWQLGASNFNLPKISAESALGIGTKMATNLSSYHSSTTNNYANDPSNKTGNSKITLEVPVYIEGREIAKASATYMKSEIDKIESREARLRGDII